MTKQERNKVYRQMLLHFHLIIEYQFGFCFMLRQGSLKIEDFPELERHRPEGCTENHYWWGTREGGYNIRRKILIAAIAETND